MASSPPPPPSSLLLSSPLRAPPPFPQMRQNVWATLRSLSPPTHEKGGGGAMENNLWAQSKIRLLMWTFRLFCGNILQHVCFFLSSSFSPPSSHCIFLMENALIKLQTIKPKCQVAIFTSITIACLLNQPIRTHEADPRRPQDVGESSHHKVLCWQFTQQWANYS